MRMRETTPRPTFPEGRVVRRVTGSADALKALLLDLKKYTFTGYVRTIRVADGEPSEGVVLVQAGNPVASYHTRGEQTELGRAALKQVWQDSYDPACSLELHARVELDPILRGQPKGALDRAKRVGRKAKAAETAPQKESQEGRARAR